MSDIRFQTKSVVRAELRGSERAWMDQICTKIAMSVLNLWDTKEEPSWTRRLLPAGHYALASRHYEHDFKTWLSVGGHGMIHPATGERVNAFAVVLNTAMRLGGDEVKLMARLHGQCEVYAYIPPQSARFVMRLIDSGRKSGLYREKMGWEALWRLLQATPDTGEIAVASYSVSDFFPPFDPETENALDWDEAVASLSKMLAIQEDGFRDYYFDNGETLMSLERAATSGV